MTKKTQKKLRKALLLISCAALLVCITVGVTVAYLTDDAKVTNTFSVGKVDITMDEATVNEYGKLLDKNNKAEGEEGYDEKLVERTDGNNYKLIANHTYTKDPTITVAATSEKALLFVKVVNPLGELETDVEGKTIEDQMTANKWYCIDGDNNIWVYGTETKATEVAANGKVVVFESFTLSDEVTNTSTAEDVVITAYAVQADGFEGKTPAEIWTAAFGE